MRMTRGEPVLQLDLRYVRSRPCAYTVRVHAPDPEAGEG